MGMDWCGMKMMVMMVMLMAISVIFLWEQLMVLVPWVALAQLVAAPRRQLLSLGLSRSNFAIVVFSYCLHLLGRSHQHTGI